MISETRRLADAWLNNGPMLDRCTLCGEYIHEYPLWGIDFPNCGPVHGDCADYDYWLSSREDQPLQRLIQQRHIREQGWLPTPCATPRI